MIQRDENQKNMTESHTSNNKISQIEEDAFVMNKVNKRFDLINCDASFSFVSDTRNTIVTLTAFNSYESFSKSIKNIYFIQIWVYQWCACS